MYSIYNLALQVTEVCELYTGWMCRKFKQFNL